MVRPPVEVVDTSGALRRTPPPRAAASGPPAPRTADGCRHRRETRRPSGSTRRAADDAQARSACGARDTRVSGAPRHLRGARGNDRPAARCCRGSNRSVLYSIRTDRPSSAAHASSARSIPAVPRCTSQQLGAGLAAHRPSRPEPRTTGTITWKSGLRLRSRSGCSSSTSCSNGRSWWRVRVRAPLRGRARAARETSGSPDEIGPHHERVHEEADQPFESRRDFGSRSASRRRCRPARCSGGAAP